MRSRKYTLWILINGSIIFPDFLLQKPLTFLFYLFVGKQWTLRGLCIGKCMYIDLDTLFFLTNELTFNTLMNFPQDLSFSLPWFGFYKNSLKFASFVLSFSSLVRAPCLHFFSLSESFLHFFMFVLLGLLQVLWTVCFPYTVWLFLSLSLSVTQQVHTIQKMEIWFWYTTLLCRYIWWFNL